MAQWQSRGLWNAEVPCISREGFSSGKQCERLAGYLLPVCVSYVPMSQTKPLQLNTLLDQCSKLWHILCTTGSVQILARNFCCTWLGSEHCVISPNISAAYANHEMELPTLPCPPALLHGWRISDLQHRTTEAESQPS